MASYLETIASQVHATVDAGIGSGVVTYSIGENDRHTHRSPYHVAWVPRSTTYRTPSQSRMRFNGRDLAVLSQRDTDVDLYLWTSGTTDAVAIENAERLIRILVRACRLTPNGDGATDRLDGQPVSEEWLTQTDDGAGRRQRGQLVRLTMRFAVGMLDESVAFPADGSPDAGGELVEILDESHTEALDLP
jgi:hypothetical protein